MMCCILKEAIPTTILTLINLVVSLKYANLFVPNYKNQMTCETNFDFDKTNFDTHGTSTFSYQYHACSVIANTPDQPVYLTQN